MGAIHLSASELALVRCALENALMETRAARRRSRPGCADDRELAAIEFGMVRLIERFPGGRPAYH